jgi:branched-chain amino acid transport system substrate-binding protein
MKPTTTRNGLRLFALVAASLLALSLVAACGKSSSAGGADTSVQGANGKDPILIGFANNEGQSISVPAYRYGAEAAVENINDNGGINGRPVKLIECLNDASPQGSVNCANKFVSQHAVAYVAGTDSGADGALPILQTANMPLVTQIPWGPQERTSPITFIFGSGISTVLFGELHALQLANIKSLGYLYYNVPAQAGTLKDVDAAGKAFGITVTDIEVSLTSPSWTSIVATAQAKHVDGLLANLKDDQCTQLVDTARSANFDKPMILGSCTSYIQKLGSSAADTYTVSPFYYPTAVDGAPAEIQAQMKTYLEYMKKIGHEADSNTVATHAFGTMMELSAVMKGMTGDITAPTLLAALKTAKVPGFLGDSIDCTKKAFPADSSACNTGILIMKTVAKGNGATQEVQGGTFFETAPK